MKNWMVLSLIGISTAASAVTVRGTLTAEVTDGTTTYRCQFEDKPNTITVALNTDQRLLTLGMAGPFTYPVGTQLKLTGPYVEAEEAVVNAAPTKAYEFRSHGYDVALTFTQGKAMPALTLAYGAGQFVCQ